MKTNPKIFTAIAESPECARLTGILFERVNALFSEIYDIRFLSQLLFYTAHPESAEQLAEERIEYYTEEMNLFRENLSALLRAQSDLSCACMQDGFFMFTATNSASSRETTPYKNSK